MDVRTTARVARVVSLVCAAGALAGSAVGQEKGPGAPAGADQARQVEWRLEFFGGQQFKTDLDRAGSVSATRAGGQMGVMVPVGERDRLTLDLAAQASSYSFEGATGLAASGDPVGTVEYFGLSGRYFHSFTDQWGAYVGGGISSSGEPGADFEETLQYAGGFGASYFFNKSLSISPGLFVRTRLEESVSIVPMVNVNWQIDDQWRLGTIYRAAGAAPGLSLSYSPSEEWTFALSGSYEDRSYRLKEDGPNPGGVFRDRRVPLDLSARWKISPQVSLEATAGVALAGEFKTRDLAGNEVSSEKLDPAPFAGLSVMLKF